MVWGSVRGVRVWMLLGRVKRIVRVMMIFPSLVEKSW